MKTCLVWFCLLSSVLAVADGNASAFATPPPDVRLVLDVSGSMKVHDPENMRSDAVSLLVRALPDDGLGGIWVFAKGTVPLVEHGPTDLFWKRLASIHTRELESRGGRSNLAEALAAATWDGASESGHERHVVLLTDGRIDISENAEENAAARQKFLEEFLPRLATTDIRVHAIVLSKDADTALLRQLTQRTKGLYLAASESSQLAAHFQRVLNRTAPPPYLPVRGQSFVVEPGLEEVTIYRRGDRDGLTLISPSGHRHTRPAPGVEVRWHDARGFDVLTLERPEPGRWRFEGELEGAVMAFSDLAIKATEVPARLFPGRLTHVDFMLFSGGSAVTDSSFLGFHEVSATLKGERKSEPLYVESLSDGLYRAHLADVVRAGPYVLELNLEGPTLARQALVPFDLANPVRVRAATDEATGDLVVWAELSDEAVDYTRLTATAQVRERGGARRLFPAERFPAGLWQIRLAKPKKSLEVAFQFEGKYLNHKDFSLKTSAVKLSVPVEEEMVFVFDQKGRAVPEPEAEPMPIESAPTPALPTASTPTVSVPEVPLMEGPDEATLPVAFAYGVGGVNLLLLGFLWFVLRPRPLKQTLADWLAAQEEAQAEPA